MPGPVTSEPEEDFACLIEPEYVPLPQSCNTSPVKKPATAAPTAPFTHAIGGPLRKPQWDAVDKLCQTASNPPSESGSQSGSALKRKDAEVPEIKLTKPEEPFIGRSQYAVGDGWVVTWDEVRRIAVPIKVGNQPLAGNGITQPSGFLNATQAAATFKAGTMDENLTQQTQSVASSALPKGNDNSAFASRPSQPTADNAPGVPKPDQFTPGPYRPKLIKNDMIAYYFTDNRHMGVKPSDFDDEPNYNPQDMPMMFFCEMITLERNIFSVRVLWAVIKLWSEVRKKDIWYAPTKQALSREKGNIQFEQDQIFKGKERDQLRAYLRKFEDVLDHYKIDVKFREYLPEGTAARRDS